MEPPVEQHTETPHPPYIVPVVGVLEAGVHVFGCGVASVYPEAHGGILPGLSHKKILWNFNIMKVTNPYWVSQGESPWALL
jgi:hypothetical protein